VKTHVLHVVGTMNRGGAETFIMNILRNIDRDKFEFYFLCFNDNKFDYEDEIIALGATIVRVPDVKKTGIIKHIGNIRRVIRKYHIDIVHSHTSYNMVFSLIAARLEDVVKRLAHSHSAGSRTTPTLVKKLYIVTTRALINHTATRRLACGTVAGVAFYGAKEFTIVYNGIDLKQFTLNGSKRAALRASFGVNEQETVVMHVGRFHEVKNHTFLLDIFNEYQKINSDSHLFLLGDGPLRKDIENKTNTLGLAKKVRFLGVRSDTSDLYNIADIFVLPSLYEGLPVVLVEAQVNGLRCLVSDTVDQTSKITNYLDFLPLGNGALDWAIEIDSLDKSRAEAPKELIGGAYDIKTSVKDIESLYTFVDRKGGRSDSY